MTRQVRVFYWVGYENTKNGSDHKDEVVGALLR